MLRFFADQDFSRLKASLLSTFVIVSLISCAAPPPKPMTVTQAPVKAAKPAARKPATGTAEDARRHMLRGIAAVEVAKSDTELAAAEEEFLIATEISPQLATAWFNLGRVQTQRTRYKDAIASFRKYLEVAPQAEDAQKVRDEIVKIEFRQELLDKTLGRAGTWIGSDGTVFQLTVQGSSLILKTTATFLPEDEVKSTYTLVGSVPVGAVVAAEYQLTQQGNSLTGMWSRDALQADKCTVPGDSANVTGEVDDANHRIILRHDVTSFLAMTQMSLLTDDFCSGVKQQGRKPKELIVYGPLGRKGGIGVTPTGLTGWWDGGFSMLNRGWQGRLGIVVGEGTPAFIAGLRSGDEILAIDGRAVKEMSAGEAVLALNGEPGSLIQLEIWRKESKQNLVVNMTRIQLNAKE